MGGIPPRPSRSPAALLGQSKAQQKSFLFLLEEKIGRAQNQKCRENFFAGRRALASGGGAASLVPLKIGSRKVYNYSTMALFTGKGDDGTTKLFDSGPGKRTSKTGPIFECLGMLDELNTLVGWCKVECPSEFVAQKRTVKIILHDVQDHLFTLQAEVAGAPKSVPLSSVEMLGALINHIEAEMPAITTFIVPGGTELSSRLDIVRAVARRAERRLIALHESGDRVISGSSRAYANRLSSLFYALARLANTRARIVEDPPRYR